MSLYCSREWHLVKLGDLVEDQCVGMISAAVEVAIG